MQRQVREENVTLTSASVSKRGGYEKWNQMARWIYRETKRDSEREWTTMRKRERRLLFSFQGNVLWLRVNVRRVNTMMFKAFPLCQSVHCSQRYFSWKPSYALSLYCIHFKTTVLYLYEFSIRICLQTQQKIYDNRRLHQTVGGNIYCKCSPFELGIAEEIDGSLVADR